MDLLAKKPGYVGPPGLSDLPEEGIGGRLARIREVDRQPSSESFAFLRIGGLVDSFLFSRFVH